MSDAAALGAGLTGKLAELAAQMRAAGARVGVDELLVAHRALAAVDPSSRRDAYNALRAVLCSRHSDIPAFDAAFLACFGSGQDEEIDLLSAELQAAGIALPRMAVPGDQPAKQQAIDLSQHDQVVVGIERSVESVGGSSFSTACFSCSVGA